MIAATNSQEKKGKGHMRSWSEDPEDPLTRDDQVDQGDASIASRLATLGLDEPGQSSSQATAPVTTPQR